MGTVWAECPEHGFFQFGGIVRGDVNATIENAAVSCPYCGRMSPAIDGRYAMRDSAGLPTTVTATSEVSARQLNRLRMSLEYAAEQLRNGAVNEEKLEHRVRTEMEKEAPGLPGLIDKALGPKSSTLAAWVAIAISVVTMLTGQAQHADGVTPEQIQQVVEQVYEQEHAAPTLPSTSTPLPATPADLTPEQSQEP